MGLQSMQIQELSPTETAALPCGKPAHRTKESPVRYSQLTKNKVGSMKQRCWQMKSCRWGNLTFPQNLPQARSWQKAYNCDQDIATHINGAWSIIASSHHHDWNHGEDHRGQASTKQCSDYWSYFYPTVPRWLSSIKYDVFLLVIELRTGL
jgi:hypothetical protein